LEMIAAKEGGSARLPEMFPRVREGLGMLSKWSFSNSCAMASLTACPPPAHVRCMCVQPICRDRLVMLRFVARVSTILATAALFAAPPAAASGSFSSSLFTFVTTVQDDGKKEPGGWQEASAPLRFVDARGIIPRIWTCSLTIGMPLRAAAYGQISPVSAAEKSAFVATKASVNVMHRQEEWLTAEFCIAFKDEVNRIFRQDYKGLGARANVP